MQWFVDTRLQNRDFLSLISFAYIFFLEKADSYLRRHETVTVKKTFKKSITFQGAKE